MDNPGSADLTRQEHIVLQLVADDYPAKQIAQLLRISDRTVNFHLGNARRKLGVGSTEAAVSRAAALNIIRVIVYDKERIKSGGDSVSSQNNGVDNVTYHQHKINNGLQAGTSPESEE